MPPNRILVLAANPSDTQGLKLRQEVDEIQAALARAESLTQFEVIAEHHVRPDDLRRALLKHQPRIVHFSVHGVGEPGLLFVDDVGKSKVVDTVTLTTLFKLCPSVECVVLNACFSVAQADAIAQHIDAVIGMTNEINDSAALKFAVGFYEALGYGRSIQDAFEFGLLSVDLNGLPASAVPVLRSRPTPNPDPDPLPPLPPPALEEPDGLVPVGSPFYIERPQIETDSYNAILRPGALLRIKAPRKMGKTSLLVRILHEAKQRDYRVVRLNFRMVEAASLKSLDDFLQWVCISVTEELELTNTLANYWSASQRLLPLRRCQQYFEKYLLKAVPTPLVLALDEVDQVFSYPQIAIDFFGMLRVWHEEAKIQEVWKKLHLVIAHSKEEPQMPDNRSPFNVGTPTELRELNLAEVETLIRQHGLRLSTIQQQQLGDLVGGHPYLLRMALYPLARGRITLPQLITTAPTDSGLYGTHLFGILQSLETDGRLVSAFRQVITSNQPVQIGSTDAYRLSTMGLVKYQGNAVVPLCGLYRQYFQTHLGQA